MKEIQYRPLGPEEITRDLFRSFERRQVVDWCWRRERGQWVIRQDPFVDQWSEADYAFLVTCLQHTLSAGGVVFGAFCEGNLKGFASVEHNPLGSRGQYRDLTSLHVSQELRGNGLGRRLFGLAVDWAKGQRSCIYPATPPSRPRPFTRPWAAGRQRNAAKSMCPRSPSTVSWNTCYPCNRTPFNRHLWG